MFQGSVGNEAACKVTESRCSTYCTNVGSAVWQYVPECKDCKSLLEVDDTAKEGCDSYCQYVGSAVQGEVPACKDCKALLLETNASSSASSTSGCGSEATIRSLMWMKLPKYFCFY